MKAEFILIIVFVIFVFFILFCILRSLYERRTVDVTNVNIAIKGLHNVKKIAFIADFHSASNKKFKEKILRNLQENGAEAVFISGDLIIGKKNADNKPAIEFLKGLCEKYPVYFTYGNHESRMFSQGIEDKDGFFKEISDIKKLYTINNNVMKLKINNISVNLYGLELEEEYYKKSNPKQLTKEIIEEKLGKRREGYTILLSHKPDFLKQYQEYGANLVLSGHNHGGTVRLPHFGGVISTSFKLFPKYTSGVYYEKDTIMVITRGLGTHTVNFRLFNKPEIVMLNFKPCYNKII